jgi:hypothetical protein
VWAERILVIVAAIGLTGCSLMDSNAEFSDRVKYIPPNPPTRPVELLGVAKAAKEEKLTGDLEISDLRNSDFGPGRWMICLRGLRDSQPTYFGVYFENEDYKGVRQSVIGDRCEQESYSPTGPLPSSDAKTDAPQASASPEPKAKRRHR